MFSAVGSKHRFKLDFVQKPWVFPVVQNFDSVDKFGWNQRNKENLTTDPGLGSDLTITPGKVSRLVQYAGSQLGFFCVITLSYKVSSDASEPQTIKTSRLISFVEVNYWEHVWITSDQGFSADFDKTGEVSSRLEFEQTFKCDPLIYPSPTT